MCVRCGTGSVAWCTNPMRHGDSSRAVSPGEPPVTGDKITPTQALRDLDRRVNLDDPVIRAAMARLWDYVVKGGS
jgi:hypothetical protein